MTFRWIGPAAAIACIALITAAPVYGQENLAAASPASAPGEPSVQQTSQTRTPSSEADAQNSNAAVEPTNDEPSPYNPLDTYSFYLTALFIAFGLGVILLQLAAMRRIATVTADEIARNCAITLVVVASVALLVSGYSSQQVAPAFGLFGTIIGYLLGKAGAKEDNPKPAQPPPPPPPTDAEPAGGGT